MSHQVSNAQNLYLRGIRDGEVAEVLANYMGTATPSIPLECLMKRKDLLPFSKIFSSAT